MRADIEALRTQIAQLQKQLNQLRRDCTHSIVPDDPNFLEAIGGHCEHCGERIFGWYCPDSPNHECEYTPANGEWCIYCHEPMERK